MQTLQRRRFLLQTESGAAPPAPGTLSTGFVFYSKLNGNADTNDVDEVGSYVLTKAGTAAGPGATAGKLNNCRTFLASDVQLLTANAAALLTALDGMAGNSDFFISAWVYLEDKSASYVFLARSSGLFNQQFVLDYDTGGDAFRFACDSTVSATTFGSPDVQTWYHLGARRTAGGEIGLAVNGVEADTSGGGGGVASGAGRKLAIGHKRTANDTGVTAGSYLNGRMDEVGIAVGVTMTPLALTNLYGAGTPPAWPFVGLDR